MSERSINPEMGPRRSLGVSHSMPLPLLIKPNFCWPVKEEEEYEGGNGQVDSDVDFDENDFRHSSEMEFDEIEMESFLPLRIPRTTSGAIRLDNENKQTNKTNAIEQPVCQSKKVGFGNVVENIFDRPPLVREPSVRSDQMSPSHFFMDAKRRPSDLFFKPETYSLHRFDSQPVVVLCQHCFTRGPTQVESKSGALTWLFAIGFVIVGLPCFSCIPFKIKKLKDVEHRCQYCQRVVGIYERTMKRIPKRKEPLTLTNSNELE